MKNNNQKIHVFSRISKFKKNLKNMIIPKTLLASALLHGCALTNV